VTRRHTDALTHPPLRGIPGFDRDPFSVLYDGPGRREAAAGPDWIHEIKHDGYRLIVRRDGATVRLFTRRGHDRTTAIRRSPRPKAKFRAKSFTIDGDAVVADADGVAVFDALHRRHRAADAVLYAFDLLPVTAAQRAQGEAGGAVGALSRRHRDQGAHRRGRRRGVPARL
jgi:hypothetical protein